MTLWKDTKNGIHDDMNGEAIHLLPAGCVSITQAEADVLRTPPQPTAQEQRDAISSAIQQMLDDKAKSLRYDSILSARSYAGYTNPFQDEALKLANWAASCWDTAGMIEYQVISGTIPMPSVQQALAMMPSYM